MTMIDVTETSALSGAGSVAMTMSGTIDMGGIGGIAIGGPGGTTMVMVGLSTRRG